MRQPLRQHASLVVAATLLLAAASVAAAGSLAPPSPEITVEGRATIYHDDLAGARERAVQAALVAALERYAGLRIESSTLIKKGELIDREVRAHTHGYVRAFEVLATRRDGGELVAKVRVGVAPEPVEESFRRLTSATTTLLLVREASLGEPVRGQILPAALADPFFTAKLVVPSAGTLEAATATVPLAFYSAPDPGTAKELGLRYLSGIVVVASADTKRLESGAGSLGYDVDPSVLRPVAAATGNLTILSGQTGEVIAARRFEDVRGSDATDVQRASAAALHELAGQMRAFVVDSLSRYVKELGFPLRVEVRGDAAAAGAPRVRQILQATRWVQHVEVASEAPGTTVLQALCTEKPTYVVEELRGASDLEIVRFDAAAGVVEVR